MSPSAETAFLKVWNSLPPGFNSKVSIKFGIKMARIVVLSSTFNIITFDVFVLGLFTSDDAGSKINQRGTPLQLNRAIVKEIVADRRREVEYCVCGGQQKQTIMFSCWTRERGKKT